MEKILYITTVGGTISTFLIEHIKYLISKGYNVECACNIDRKIDEELITKYTKLYKISFERNPLHPKNKNAYKEIKELQKKEQYDIIHVHTPIASFITRLALKNYSNVKVVYTCHGFHFYRGGSPINWMLFYPLEKIAAKWTDALITINTEDYKVANRFKLRNNGKVSKIHGVGIEKEKYIVENFDKSNYRQTLDIKDDDFVILVLAELNKNKNHIQLIKAMNLLKDKYPNIKAIFAGTGPLEEDIKSQIKENGLEDKISLLGWRNDVKELINSSDVVGLFSKREGLGKCLLEAMICGKCVIATNTRGPRELVEDNVNGFIFEVGDIEATAKSIEKIYVDNKLRNEFEERVITKTNKYLLESVLEELSGIYEDIYEKKSINIVGETL